MDFKSAIRNINVQFRVTSSYTKGNNYDSTIDNHAIHNQIYPTENIGSTIDHEKHRWEHTSNEARFQWIQLVFDA